MDTFLKMLIAQEEMNRKPTVTFSGKDQAD